MLTFDISDRRHDEVKTGSRQLEMTRMIKLVGEGKAGIWYKCSTL